MAIAKLCRWFGIPRRTVYYKPVKAAPKVDPWYSEPIKNMIKKEPSFGYRTVAWLLGFNKNTVQRIFRLKGWQVRKRTVGMPPRIQAVPSDAAAPNERWSTDLARIWIGKDGWPSLALVINCHTRAAGLAPLEVGQGHDRQRRTRACADREVRYPGRVEEEFLLRSDDGLVFTSPHFTVIVRSYGLMQEFITPHCPQQNCMPSTPSRLTISQSENRPAVILKRRTTGLTHDRTDHSSPSAKPP